MKTEAIIAIDTNFTFNGHRVLLEALPVKSDEDLEKEIQDFRGHFWHCIDYWDRSQKTPEIIDHEYLKKKEAAA